MSDILLGLILVLVTVIFFLQLSSLKRKNDAVPLDKSFDSLQRELEKIQRLLKEELVLSRSEAYRSAKEGREELNNSLKNVSDSLFNQLTRLTRINEEKLDKVRGTVEDRLKFLQEDNSQKLEKMRLTVDEKLHATLEQRLGESFKLVSDRLEMVHKGLGEMQTLASGVGDLKKVLSNVKTRGTWGEIQLGNLLEQILSLDQYAINVITKQGSNDRVEFAVKLPARDGGEKIIYLPIDAKFPMEDYQRLLEAQDQSNLSSVEECGKALESRVKGEAKAIKEKYIDPPNTTDFGILFLPVEGLYAEVLRRPGLCETLQRDYRVVVTGPTTLAALLNSLQMGFRTLAIEKRSSEVWALLGAVKTDFGKFGDILEKTHKKLQEASNTIETAARKTRTIERKLRNVQELPPSEAIELLGELEDKEAEVG